MRIFTISASTYHFALGDWGEFQDEKPFILRNCHSVIPFPFPFPFPFPDSGFLVLIQDESLIFQDALDMVKN